GNAWAARRAWRVSGAATTHHLLSSRDSTMRPRMPSPRGRCRAPARYVLSLRHAPRDVVQFRFLVRHRGWRRHGGVDGAELRSRLEMHLDHAVRPSGLQIALDPRHRLVVAPAQLADAV